MLVLSKIANSVQIIWRRANPDLVSFSNQLIFLISCPLSFQSLLCYPIVLASQQRIIFENNFTQNVWWLMTLTTIHRTGTNGKIGTCRSFIEDPLLAKGQIFMMFEKIQNQILKIWFFYRMSEHRRRPSPPILGSFEPIFRSGKQKPKSYVYTVQNTPKLN